MKRMLSILMSLLLLWSLALPAAAAETAATLRLEKTEGTVSVSNASGKSVTVTKGMRLYSGYTISTEKDSYAYVSLDSTKAVKLDASSKAEVQKSGKKLELTATAGKLFFNVSAPVDKDESLNIRTSTMVTGVRGTSGWVEVTNRFTSRVHLLEGTLTVTSSEPATGQMRQATITSGQTATATLKGISQPGGQMTLTVTPVQEKLVPGFVAVEVEKNPALQQKIAAKSHLSVPAIIGGAWTRLENEQASANAANQKIQQDLNKIAADDVDQVFQSPAEDDDDDDDDDDEPYVPPAEPETPPTEPETPPAEPETPPAEPDPPSVTSEAELVAALEAGLTPINITADITLTSDCTVPSGKTLNIESGKTLTLNSALTINGTVNVSGTLANAGTLTILSTESIHIKSGGILTNTNTIRVGDETAAGLLQVESGGTLNNTAGSITIAASVNDINSQLNSQGSFTNGATLTNNGIITNTNTFENNGTFANDNSFTSNGTFTNGSSATFHTTGIASISSTATNSGTIIITGTNGLQLTGGDLTNSGTINVGQGENSGCLTVSAGTLTNNNILNVGVYTLKPSELVIQDGGTLNNSSSSLNIDETMGRVNNAGTFINSGEFGVTGQVQFVCSGTYQDQRSGLYIMVKSKTGNAVSYLGLAAGKPAWSDSTTVILLGTGGGTLAGGSFTASDVLLDLNGRTAELNESLLIGEQGSTATPSLTITDSSSEKTGVLTTPTVGETEQGFDTISVYSGSLTLNGGTVTSTKGFPINVRGGTVNISGGAVTSTYGNAVKISGGELTVSGSGTISSTGGNGISASDSAVVNITGGAISSSAGTGIEACGRTVNISDGAISSSAGTGIEACGGTVNISDTAVVEGATFGVRSLDAVVNISGGTVTLTAEPTQTEDSIQLDGYAVSGPFTFSGGTLRAKARDNIFDKEFPPQYGGVVFSDVPEEGYYTATAAPPEVEGP